MRATLPSSALLALALLTMSSTLPRAAEGQEALPRGGRIGARARADLVVPRDLPTIQAAIDAVEDGGSIFVLPGEYRETLTILGKRVRLSGGGRAVLVAEPTRAVDAAERAVGLINYREGGGGVIEGFTLRGGLNGIVGHARGNPGGLPLAAAGALTVRSVEIVNTGRGILWRAPADLTISNTRISNVRHNGIVFRPVLGAAFIKVVDVAVHLAASFGYLIIDTPSIGCQNQLVNAGSVGASLGGIGVYRSGVCIFGGVLLANLRNGIYFQQSAAIVDGTQILETVGPDPVGIRALGSDLQQVVHTELDHSGTAGGIFLWGSRGVIGWNTLNCHSYHLGGATLPAGFFGTGQPPAPVLPDLEPLFGQTGGNQCGCGSVSEACLFQTVTPLPTQSLVPME
jgi:hypothetical protein